MFVFVLLAFSSAKTASTMHSAVRLWKQKCNKNNSLLMKICCCEFWCILCFFFLDSIDTKTSMKHVRELVGTCNVYVSTCQKNAVTPNHVLLKNIATYITDLLKVNRTINAQTIKAILLYLMPEMFCDDFRFLERLKSQTALVLAVVLRQKPVT